MINLFIILINNESINIIMKQEEKKRGDVSDPKDVESCTQ